MNANSATWIWIPFFALMFGVVGYLLFSEDNLVMAVPFVMMGALVGWGVGAATDKRGQSGSVDRVDSTES